MVESVFAQITVDHQVQLVQQEIGPPAPGEVQVKALYSTISAGTESELIAGHILPLPQPLGYSLCGEITQIGEAVRGFCVGDKVVATATHAKVQNLDHRMLAKVPSGCPADAAAFFNLAHTALYGIRRTNLTLGEPCVILGQGLVGLLTTALAKATGAGPIICSDFDDNRLALARSLGADCAVNTASSHQALTQALSDYDLATIPVVFEATGARRTLEQAVELLAEQGRLMMLSQGDGETLPNIAQGLMMKGATLIGGYVNSKPYALFRSDLKIKQRWPPQYDGDVNKTESHQYNTSLDDITTFLKLISLNRIDLAPLITHRFQWQDLPKAYQQVTARDASLVGGVIDWSNP